MKKMKTIALSKVKQNSVIGLSDGVANPGSHCPMHTVLSTIMQFEGLSSLVVGMGECGYYSRYVTEYNWGQSFLKDQKQIVKTAHYVYEMDSNEVVFGCREGLMKALHDINQEGIPALIIIGTCIPALIGEDIGSLIEEVMAEKNMFCKIGYIDAAHFKYNGYGSGFYKVYEQLGKLYADKSANNTILFLGEGQGEEYYLLKQQLQQFGYQIRIFKNGLAFEEWTSLFDGIGVLVFQETMVLLAKWLEREKLIPCFYPNFCYTDNQIQDFYCQISDYFGLNNLWKEKIIQNKERNREGLELFYKKRQCIIGSSSVNPLGITLMLEELQCKVSLLHMEEWIEPYKELKEELLKIGSDPFVTYYLGSNSAREVLENESGEWLFIGDWMNCEQHVQITAMELRDLTTTIGYERRERFYQLLQCKMENKGD